MTDLSLINGENNSLLPIRWNYSCLSYFLDHTGQPQDPKISTGFKHLSCYTAQTCGFAVFVHQCVLPTQMVLDRSAVLLVQCLAGQDRELKDDSVAAQCDSSTCELWLLYHL